MHIKYIFIVLLFVPVSSFAQHVITKPVGCFAGTNGMNSAVLSHADARGVLLMEKWADIEPAPGVYDFTALNNKINTVKAAGLKYALAIAAGAFGSPDWLIDSLNANYHRFQYQDQTWRLPLWWDSSSDQKLTDLITQLGNEYASDTALSHVYVSQMTVNGVEGHLNGVDMAAFAADGFTNEKWISAAKSTARSFANAFPDKPIVFEVHEINYDTIVPATIINDLKNDPSLCNRVGLGMWWISGKTSYQSDLIDFIYNFEGDKYAQVIGRSDQTERFEDRLYASVFAQAKYLNIRYIEPWPYEFQYHTNDSLIQDFNRWAEANFAATDTCMLTTTVHEKLIPTNEPVVYPNPTSGVFQVEFDASWQKFEVEIFNLSGQRLLTASNPGTLDISSFPNGLYFITFTVDHKRIGKTLLKMK